LGDTMRPWVTAALLAAILLVAAEGSTAGETPAGALSVRHPERFREEKLLLSLRVARANRNERATARYKCLLRQHRWRERHSRTGPRIAGPSATGRCPPSGR
jgi:hypothetical protein